MITEREFYDHYTDFDILITGMNERLLDAQKKNPEMDIERALQKINMLRRLQNAFHKLYHECMTIDNGSGQVLMEREKYIRRIAQLEKENEELKQNLRL